MPQLVDKIVNGEPIDVESVFAWIYHIHTYGGLSEGKFAEAIFDPALKTLVDLPVGLLDEKEEFLPNKHIPETKDALRRHCERMIILDQNPVLVASLVEGWPGVGSWEAKFERHLNDMWQIHATERPLYRALVTGRHNIVVRALRTRTTKRPIRRPLNPVDADRVLRALRCQTLLWCAHDVQLIIARNLKAAHEPMGELLSSGHVLVEPERVLNDARERRATLDALLGAYRDHREEGKPDDELNGHDFSKDDRVPWFASQVRRQATLAGVCPDRPIPGLDDVLEKLADRLKRTQDDFLGQTASERTHNVAPKSFHALWFSGLSNLRATCVTILRYVQAELEVADFIREYLPEAGRARGARRGLALQAYRVKRSSRTKRRELTLLDAYRRHLLKDPPLGSEHNQHVPPSQMPGYDAVRAAAAFLEERGDRLIGDDHGGPKCPRRTFYLLDVIPEHRLAVGSF